MSRARGSEQATVEDSCDWRTLALGIASLLSQMPEHGHQEGMLHVVARELKAPVATLRAHAEQLQTQVDDQLQVEAARELAGNIVEQADIMAGWVGAILDVQRIRLGKLPLELRDVDLIELVRTAVADFEEARGGGIKIRFVDGLPTNWRVLGDPDRLARVLDCLLGSMARYAAGRPLELRIEARDWADGLPRAILHLSDAGREPLTDDLQEVPGSRTHVPLRSAGQAPLDLELYVAREIIRLHGGDLWAEQRSPGEGGNAVVILPLHFWRRSHAVLARSPTCSGTR